MTQLPQGVNTPKGIAAVLTGLACVLRKVNAEGGQGLSDEKDVALGSTDLTELSPQEHALGIGELLPW